MNNLKITTIVILITSCFTLSCSNDPSEYIDDIYVYITDNHFETILIEQGIDSDGIVNQKILKSEAEAVSRLDLNLNTTSGEIIDLTGVEGFINLTLLSAGNQKLENIDLSYNTFFRYR